MATKDSGRGKGKRKQQEGYEYDGCVMRRRAIKNTRSCEFNLAPSPPRGTSSSGSPKAIKGVEFVTQLHVTFVVLIHRPEGMRIQYFKVDAAIGSTQAGKADFPAMRWDSVSMKAVRVDPLAHAETANTVKYVFKFGQKRNDARCTQHSTVEIRLRDPRNRVCSLQVASCGSDECPSSLRKIRIANFCGQFVCDNALDIASLGPILCKVRKDFGAVFALFCARGHVTVYKDLRTCFLRGSFLPFSAPLHVL